MLIYLSIDIERQNSCLKQLTEKQSKQILSYQKQLDSFKDRSGFASPQSFFIYYRSQTHELAEAFMYAFDSREANEISQPPHRESLYVIGYFLRYLSFLSIDKPYGSRSIELTTKGFNKLSKKYPQMVAQLRPMNEYQLIQVGLWILLHRGNLR